MLKIDFMKKFLIILSILCLSLPCFAGNLLQQEYEATRMQEIAQESVFRNMSKESLLENDYQSYLNGGRSLYGYLLASVEENSKSSLDFKYNNLMLKQYKMYTKTYNHQLFRLKKIIVDDNDYKLLKEETKSVIAGFNLIAY